MKKGKVIVLEGPDGSGKHTQATLLVSRLKNQGHRVETMDFPRYTQTVTGAFIKECQQGMHGDFVSLSPYLASFPYAVDRFEEKQTLIDWLNQGAIIVLDRYVSASQIHQGGKIISPEERRTFLHFLDTLEHETLGIPRPDLVVYLQVSIETSMRLLEEKRDKVNQVDNDLTESAFEYQKNTRHAARDLMQMHSWECIECESEGVLKSPSVIAEEVYLRVASLF